MNKDGNKSNIKMRCRDGTWTVSVVDYYGVELTCMADSVRTALRGLKDDMNFIERGLIMRYKP